MGGAAGVELDTGEGGSDLIVVLSCFSRCSLVMLLHETVIPVTNESFELVVFSF